MKFVDCKNLHPEKDEYYYSARVKLDNLKEDEEAEIKCSVPIQVRINGGEWVDVRPIDSNQQA